MYSGGGDGKPRGFGFGGFSINKSDGGSVGGDGISRMGSSSGQRTLQPGRTMGYKLKFGRSRVTDDDDYFDDDHEEVNNSNNEAYQPAPGSPGADKGRDGDSDSDDPLDAFMANIEKEVEEDSKPAKKEKKKEDKGVRDDIEQEDVEEAYYRYMEENPMAGVLADEAEELNVEYDNEGNIVYVAKDKVIDPLPPLDHSDIDYEQFERNFYEPHPDIQKLSEQDVNELRSKLDIWVSGLAPPRPVCSFAHFGFDDALVEAIRKSEYSQPTPIQAQGIPIALSGRDIIGIAKTGSGKTAAFVWPLLIHIMAQKELEKGDGPIGLILAPTRELSQQIYQECKRFGKVYNINTVCAYGGGSMWEQQKACQDGAEIIVATPGRLIDLIKKKSTNLKRVTFLVYDEADRMFDMGFEAQVRSIADHVRPDRQTLLFSATFRRKVEKLARDILADPIRVVQGEAGVANEDVTQMVEVLPPGPAKWTWLVKRLVEMTTLGSVLIFVTRKANSEELAANLRSRDFKVLLLHGDMSQMERNEVIHSFKKKEVPILVATDVAARGLDIPSIKTVVNYDVARDIDTHTHRVGRTGRAGEKGFAFTLVTEKDREFAGALVRNLEAANQHVPQPLLDLAMQCPWFRKTRVQQSKGKRLMAVPGGSLGQKERPGLGAETSTRVQDSTSFSSYRAGSALGGRGPQSDRMAAMKTAFSAQYKTNFIAATDSAPKSIPIGIHEPENPDSHHDAKRRKKSRWD
ncbi:ATP-dependent RNA helicase DDX42-like [Dreissena polymorpha]|nr:ATP-dependent RNA helicase DDX42-like [Dreissena polymorpha]